MEHFDESHMTACYLRMAHFIFAIVNMKYRLLQESNINIDEPMFQPFPSEIFFQNFVSFETYEVPFQLRNNDKVRMSK